MIPGQGFPAQNQKQKIKIINGLNRWFVAALSWIFLIGAGCFLHPSSSYADEVSGAVPVAGSSRIIHEFSPPTGTYLYRVTWGIIPAGKASVSFTRESDLYRIVANARATGIIDRIYRLRYEGEGEIDAEDLHPIRTALRSQEGRKQRENLIEYQDDGTIKTVKTRVEEGEKPSVEKKIFNFGDTLFDPFSAVFLARSVFWSSGLSQEFEIFTGSEHFRVELNAMEKTTLELEGAKREAWVIVPTIENLSNPEKNSKVESVTLYLSADENRDLLLIESRVFIGRVRVQLESFSPL